MSKVPPWMFEGLWLHLWTNLTHAINSLFHDGGPHYIKTSLSKSMDWFLYILSLLGSHIEGLGSRVPGPESRVPGPTFPVCLFYTYICYWNAFQNKYITQITFHVLKQSHARVTSKEKTPVSLLFLYTFWGWIFP